ncbi:MAG: hypothetical protein FJ033_06810 [Chloroflexi bacterium]|nr:hypothetical protein [Chloroflexota bacterium]
MAIERRCPRCRGRMWASEDLCSEYMHCLHCGMSQEISELSALDTELEGTLRPYRAALGLAPARPRVR